MLFTAPLIEYRALEKVDIRNAKIRTNCRVSGTEKTIKKYFANVDLDMICSPLRSNYVLVNPAIYRDIHEELNIFPQLVSLLKAS